MHNGLLLIDKEPRCTSHDVVRHVRSAVGQRKIGHCGTLDPDATGLLLMTLGRGTRLTRFLIRAPKVYVGTLRFGTTTDTYDASGTVVDRRETTGLDDGAIRDAMQTFVGEYRQTPPPFCAKKVKGVKYYELARRGEEVPRESTTVTVFDFVPCSDLAEDRVEFRLSCSSGTYARSLVHELGTILGPGAHLEKLRRLQVGPFKVEDAVRVETLQHAENGLDGVGGAWIPFDEIPLPFAEIAADAQQERRIAHGQTVLVRHPIGEEGDWVKLTNSRQEFIAVGTVIERIGSAGGGVVQPRIVFK